MKSRRPGHTNVQRLEWKELGESLKFGPDMKEIRLESNILLLLCFLPASPMTLVWSSQNPRHLNGYHGRERVTEGFCCNSEVDESPLTERSSNTASNGRSHTSTLDRDQSVDFFSGCVENMSR